MRACRLQLLIGCNTLYLHAPGRTLVDEGVDDYSRSGALDVAGPVSSTFHFVNLMGWPPSVKEVTLTSSAR